MKRFTLKWTPQGQAPEASRFLSEAKHHLRRLKLHKTQLQNHFAINSANLCGWSHCREWKITHYMPICVCISSFSLSLLEEMRKGMERLKIASLGAAKPKWNSLYIIYIYIIFMYIYYIYIYKSFSSWSLVSLNCQGPQPFWIRRRRSPAGSLRNSTPLWMAGGRKQIYEDPMAIYGNLWQSVAVQRRSLTEFSATWC